MEYSLIDIETLPSVANLIKEHSLTIGLDLETTGLNCRTSKIITLQFGTVEHAFILDCRPFYASSEKVQNIWKQAIALLVDSCSNIVGHNIGFDFIMMYHHFNVAMTNIVDTEIQELIIHGVGFSNSKAMGVPVNMLDTASRYGLEVSKEDRPWFIDLDLREDWNLPLPDKQIEYCSQDVRIPLLINEQQTALLEEKELTQVATLENACIAPIARMQYDGCFIDTQRWQEAVTLKKELREALTQELVNTLSPYIVKDSKESYNEAIKELNVWEESLKLLDEKLKKEYNNTPLMGITWSAFKTQNIRKFKEMYPKPKVPKQSTGINLNSPKQLKSALNAMGIPLEATGKEYLEPFKNEHLVINTLLEWRKLDKLINSFGDTFLNKIDIDGRIHPQYHQIGATTGRMSCSNPNWQQIPSHEDESKGATVRSCVVAEKGNNILTADFSNIELRILAEMSQDSTMLDLFDKDVDLHSSTARMMFNLSEDIDPKKVDLTPGVSYRSAAKTINFGLMYGMSPVSLAKTLKISQDLAENLFTSYFKTYPQVKEWLERESNKAVKLGYSLTIMGRKRFYDTSYQRCKVMSVTKSLLQSMYKRQAKNAPIQGTSADITKHALVILYRNLPIGVRIVACVHDEIVLECSEDKIKETSEVLAQAMYTACKYHLRTVAIPPVDTEENISNWVTVSNCWKKG